MGACCHLVSGNLRCSDVPSEAHCTLLQGSWGGPATVCNWYDCATHTEIGACCTPWTCIDRLTAVRCGEIPNTTHFPQKLCSAVSCPGGEDEPGCYPARPDSNAAGQPNWTLDLCASAAFVPGRLEGEPGPGFRLVSRRALRAINFPAGQEPCRHQKTPMALNARGYGTPVLCNNPFEGNPVDENRVGRMFAVLQNGYAVFLGGYHTPYWTEAILRSSQLVCTGIVD